MDNLTEQGNTSLTTDEAWGAEGAVKEDILVPRLQLMHELSQKVKDRKAEPGDIINSTTGEKLAREGEPIEMIAFTTFREWNVVEVDDRGRDKKLIQKMPITPENEHLAIEGVEDGKPFRRIRTINFFVLLPSKLNDLPFLVTFRKSGYYAGRKLSTHFQECAMKKVPPASQIYTLSSYEKSWEGNTFKCFDVAPGRPTQADELAVARKWYDTFKQSEVKVQEEDDFNPDMYEQS